MVGSPNGASADELNPRYTVKHPLAVIGVLASSGESTGLQRHTAARARVRGHDPAGVRDR
jgi:hypothetical protein